MMESPHAILSISDTLAEVASFVEGSLPSVRKRLTEFLRAFNREYKVPKERAFAESLAWALMEDPITLYALKLNGAALVELHAILERFATRDLNESRTESLLTVDLKKFAGRAGLVDLAKAYLELGIWNRQDVKFCIALNKLRNGVAHKNPCIISNRIRSGRPIHIVDIDSVMAKVDIIPYILTTIHLLIKLVNTQTVFEWTSD